MDAPREVSSAVLLGMAGNVCLLIWGKGENFLDNSFLLGGNRVWYFCTGDLICVQECIRR